MLDFSSTYRDTDTIHVLDGTDRDHSPELGNGEPRPSTSSYRRTGTSQSLLNGNASPPRHAATSQSSQSTLNGDTPAEASRLSFVTQRRRITRNTVPLPCG